MFKVYLEDTSGATAIEYGLIAALIGIAIISSSIATSGSISNMFVRISNKMG